MKAYEITTAIEQAKSAINNLAWLNVEQLRFARHIIVDGISELVQEKLAEELEAEAKQDETICLVHELKEKQEF
jgi:hypothetical protein